jgi:hypothetical protein
MSDTQARLDARDALQRAIRHTRKRFSAGTPEKYPATPLYGLRLSEAEALAAELERVTAALRVLADDDSWEVTPQYQTDGRYRFNCPPDSVYATPWGFARETLAGGARAAQEDK